MDPECQDSDHDRQGCPEAGRQESAQSIESRGRSVSPEWIAGKAVELIQDASRAEEIDHQSCARYLDILSRVLKAHPSKAPAENSELAETRRLLLEAAERERA